MSLLYIDIGILKMLETSTIFAGLGLTLGPKHMSWLSEKFKNIK